ncbi:MAG: TetR/AcrR family transcriptional regulator [Caldilineaceae bacterium]|nr:TetR/AcrR family transcriptional regulator [Caldilineaceae bacterium]
MNKRFQKQLTQARRQQIIDAAVQVIAEQGFQNTTIKQIAARAEVADGTIYNYFKNKDDILLAIIRQVTEVEVRDLHFAEAQQMKLSDFVHEYVAHRMAEVDEGYPIMKVLIGETLANPQLVQQVYDEVYRPAFGAAEHFFQQLMAQGQLRNGDPALFARLFAAPVLGLLTLRMMGDDHVAENWPAYAEAVGNGLLSMLENKANSEK